MSKSSLDLLDAGDVNTKSKTYREIEEIIQCPICHELSTAPMYQCTNGHILCSGCIDCVKMCPICRVDLPVVKIRNLPVEQLVGAFVINCKNQDEGCKRKLKLKDLPGHLAHECFYEGHGICTLLGSKCNEKVSWANFQNHVANTAAHKQTTLIGTPAEHLGFGATEGLIHYQVHERNLTNKRFKTWEPVFIFHDGKVFTVLSSFNKSDQTITLSCLVDDSKLLEKYVIEVTLQRPAKGTKKLQWTGDILDLSYFKEGIVPSVFRIPVSVIQQDFSESSSKLNRIKLFKWDVRILIQRESDYLGLEPADEPGNPLQSRSTFFCPNISFADEDDDLESHAGVICCKCGADPIKGIRYRCAECPDYDFCGTCEKTGVHGHHLLIRITSPLLNDRLLGLTNLLEFAGPSILMEGRAGPNFETHIRYRTFFERQCEIWVDDTEPLYKWIKSTGKALGIWFQPFCELVDYFMPRAD